LVKNTRDWIAALEAAGLVNRFAKSVDARNCSAIISENYKQATLFEKVQGYDYSVLANSFSSRKMMELALELKTDRDILTEYQYRVAHPIPPQFAANSENPRCQEVIVEGLTKVDLTKLPILLQHELDGAPYITAGVLVAKDPTTGAYNIGIYRLMYRTKNELGINITAPHKLRYFYQKAFDMKRPLEVAVCLGLHALDLLAAVTSSSEEQQDELAIWGGLQKEAIKMVKCRTIDLYVPEHAEIILEAIMKPVGWTEPEGMYGEFPGTYSGMRKNPYLKILAITSRRDAVYQSATHGGRHLAFTDFFVIIPQIELDIFHALKSAGIDVKQVRIIEESAGMICYVSINARAFGDSRNALYIILTGSKQNFPKYCVVVDSDIDVFDNEAMAWAISTRSQPKEDATIIDGLRIPSSSDPSLLSVRIMSKLGIDATVPFGENQSRFVHSRPPQMQEYCEPVNEEDEKLIDSKILDWLRTNGPSFFYEVIMNLQHLSYRSILLSWGRLREKEQIDQGMDGRYSIRDTE
jgi:2,5-furandicarboxylate decarboxylase 1